MNASRIERTVFRVLPVITLAVAYAGLCAMTGTAWPWHHVVHEDGSRTLLATVFFVEHAARELLPDAVLAIGVAGAVRFYFPTTPLSAAEVRGRLFWRAFFVTGVLTAVGVGTIWFHGGQALVDNLSQLHTRSGAPLVWGAHWRYHLIERFAQIMLAFSLAGAVWHLRGRPDAGRNRSFKVFGSSLILFAALTLVFRPTAEPFNDPVFLGHQLRELFTHSLVTLPLALGACLRLANASQATSMAPGLLSPGTSGPILATGGAAVISGGFLLIASVMADAQAQGQADGLAALLFPHFAEHAIGYVFVPALASLIYLSSVSPPSPNALPRGSGGASPYSVFDDV